MTNSEPEEVGLSDEPVRGTRRDIVLHSRAVHEDTDIRIRATKTFDSRKADLTRRHETSGGGAAVKGQGES